MNLLGIDFGKHSIGLAIVFHGQSIALPLKTLRVQKSEQALDHLSRIISEENISVIVIGRPLGLQGQETEQTKIIDQFVEQLKTRFSHLMVECEEERYTSQQAERLMRGVPNGKKYKRHDIAAMMILQTYIDRQS